MKQKQRAESINLMSAQYIEALIYEYINRQYPRDINVVWVSELANCLRYAYYIRMLPVKFEKTIAVKMALGIGFHELLAKIIEEKGIATTESKLQLDLKSVKIIGRVDILGDGIIIEVKTTEKLPEKPYIEHYRQIQYYLNLANVDKGLLLYIEYSGRMRGFTVIRKKKYYNEMISRALTLVRALKTKKPPPYEKTINCTHCYFKYKCKPWKAKR